MNLRQELQEMFEAQQRMILELFEQFKLDNQKELAKVQLNISAQIQELQGQLVTNDAAIMARCPSLASMKSESEDQLVKSSEPVPSDTPDITLKDTKAEAMSLLKRQSDKPATPESLEHCTVKKSDGNNENPALIAVESERKETPLEEDVTEDESECAEERRKIYEIMCLVYNMNPTGDNFEDDERFSNIIKKLENDAEHYKYNGYNIHNKNLSIVRELNKLWEHQYTYHRNHRKNDRYYDRK
jgi:hypothetical protein